jgi:diguanylate cyclase (GGDEF)-like protein
MEAMLATLAGMANAAVLSVDAGGIISHISVGKRPSAMFRRIPGNSFLRVLKLIFGLTAVRLREAYESAARTGRVVRLSRVQHESARNLTEYLDWQFVPCADSGTMTVCVVNVSDSVGLEQEFNAITEQNETVNRDFLAAMSNLDFQLMELDQAHKKLAALYQITSAAQRRLDEQGVLEEIIVGLTSELGYSCAAILLLDEARQELMIKAHRGYTMAKSVPYGKGIVWQAVLNRRLVYVADVRKDSRYIPATVNGVSEVAVPLICADKVIGVLDVETSEERPLHPYDHDLLGSLAGQVAVTIAHAQHVAKVETQAITDGLTGLNNYRYFLSQLELEFKRAKRYKRPMSLLMLDIDDFKHFNDCNGHSCGNELLVQLAEMMRAFCRDVDCIVRYGGEEFVVLFPETGPAEAYAVAERIRAAVAAYPFHGRGKNAGSVVTVSIGVASYPADASSSRELLEHADQALYAAKRSAKNRVVVYGSSQNFTHNAGLSTSS